MKVHGDPYRKGDLIWPVIKKGASHNLGLALSRYKKISESTYRIQQLNGNRQQKVVHFDRVKTCSAALLVNFNTLPPDQTDNEAPVTS